MVLTGTFNSVKLNGTPLAESTDYTMEYGADFISITVIPEPASLFLLLSGIAGILLFTSRRKGSVNFSAH